MNLIAWIVVGLIAGVIAKALMPGGQSEPSGWVGTILLGIVGAVVGGWLSAMFLGGGGVVGFSIGSLVISVIGACALIGILRLLKR